MKTIVVAAYNIVHKMLPSLLPALLPPLKRPPAYAIRDIPGKGKGVIATRDISLGEIVVVERPVLICPAMVYGDATMLLEEYAEKSMNREDWDKLDNLANVHGDDRSKLDGIVVTNAFIIKLKGGKESYGGVFLELSRLNHRYLSCFISHLF